MSNADLELARRFANALGSRELEAICAFLAGDAEWVTDRRTLRGLSEIRGKLGEKSGESHENLDPEVGSVEWDDGEDGRVVCRYRFSLLWKQTGEVAAASNVREEVTIRGGKIVRYERRMKWE